MSSKALLGTAIARCAVVRELPADDLSRLGEGDASGVDVARGLARDPRAANDPSGDPRELPSAIARCQRLLDGTMPATVGDGESR